MPYNSRILTGSGEDITKWTSPLKLYEYLAAGRPIVASDVIPMRSVLTHEDNALLTQPDNADSLRAAIQRLIDEKGLGANLAASARKMAEANTWAARAKKFWSWRVLNRFSKWTWGVIALTLARAIMIALMFLDVPKLDYHVGWAFYHGGDEFLYFKVANDILAGKFLFTTVSGGWAFVVALATWLTQADHYEATLPVLTPLNGIF